MMAIAKSLVHGLGSRYVKALCRAEYRDQKKMRKNERSIEYRFVFESLTNLRPERVLDVGSGTTALPHLMRNCGYLVTAVDNIEDYWPRGMVNRHFHVLHDDITRTRLTEQFDLITCISVLEHIKDHAAAMRSMFSLLNPGGHLVLTCPYNEKSYIENCYELPGSGYGQDAAYGCQAFSRAEIVQWLKESGGKLLKQEYWQFFTGPVWSVGEVLSHPRAVRAEESHHLTCLLFEK